MAKRKEKRRTLLHSKAAEAQTVMAPPIVLPQPPSPHFYDETPQEYDMNKSSIVSCSLFVRSFFADELTGIST